MLPLASISGSSADKLGEFLPKLGAALAILVIGLIVIRVVARVLREALSRAGLDRLAERVGVHDLLVRVGFERSLTRVAVGGLRIVGVAAVVLVALSTLGLRGLDDAINQAVLFLPRLIAAIVIVLVGLALSAIARERVDRVAYQMALRGPIGAAAQTVVIVVTAIVALGQVGVATSVLVVVSAIVLGGIVLTGALAFGLGSQHLTREISAGRYVSGAFAVGDEITVDGLRGEIDTIETASITLRTSDGRHLRLPNSQLMSGPVELHR